MSVASLILFICCNYQLNDMTFAINVSDILVSSKTVIRQSSISLHKSQYFSAVAATTMSTMLTITIAFFHSL